MTDGELYRNFETLAAAFQEDPRITDDMREACEFAMGEHYVVYVYDDGEWQCGFEPPVTEPEPEPTPDTTTTTTTVVTTTTTAPTTTAPSTTNPPTTTTTAPTTTIPSTSTEQPETTTTVEDKLEDRDETSLYDSDLDNDGIIDIFEEVFGTDPENNDHDYDGVEDGDEYGPLSDMSTAEQAEYIEELAETGDDIDPALYPLDSDGDDEDFTMPDVQEPGDEAFIHKDDMEESSETLSTTTTISVTTSTGEFEVAGPESSIDSSLDMDEAQAETVTAVAEESPSPESVNGPEIAVAGVFIGVGLVAALGRTLYKRKRAAAEEQTVANR